MAVKLNMEGKEVYIDVENLGFPDIEKPTQSGRYESDFAKIARAIHSATEGRSRQHSYNVNEKTGAAKARYIIPKEYLKSVMEVINKTSEDITSQSSFASSEGEVPLLYSASEAGNVATFSKRISYKSQQARRSAIAELKSLGVSDYKDTGKSIIADIPVDSRILSDLDALKKFVNSLLKETKRLNKEATKKEKEKKEKEEKREEKEKEKKEKQKEREEEEEKKKRKETLSKIGRVVAILTSIFFAIKRILNALTEAAYERQKDAIEGASLGFTTKELRDIKVFETHRAIPLGTVRGAAEKFASSFASPLTFNENDFTALGEALSYTLGDKTAQSTMNTVTKKLKDKEGGYTSKEATYDILTALMKGWEAKGRDEGALSNTLQALENAGFKDFAELLSAYAESNLKGLTFQGFMAQTRTSVEPEGMDEATKTWNAFAAAILALKQTLESEFMRDLAPAIKELTKIINAWIEKKQLKYGTVSAEEMRGKEISDLITYTEADTGGDKAKALAEIYSRVRTNPADAKAYYNYLLSTGKKPREASAQVYQMWSGIFPSTGVTSAFTSGLTEFWKNDTIDDVTKAGFISKAKDILENNEYSSLKKRLPIMVRNAGDVETVAAYLYYINALRGMESNVYHPYAGNIKDIQVLQNFINPTVGYLSPSVDTSSTYSPIYHTMADREQTLKIQIEDRNGVTDIASIKGIMLNYDSVDSVTVANKGNGYELSSITGDFGNG